MIQLKKLFLQSADISPFFFNYLSKKKKNYYTKINHLDIHTQVLDIRIKDKFNQ